MKTTLNEINQFAESSGLIYQNPFVVVVVVYVSENSRTFKIFFRSISMQLHLASVSNKWRILQSISEEKVTFRNRDLVRT